jgi:hypothetical protein
MPTPHQSRQATLPLEAETFSPPRVLKRATAHEANQQAAEIILHDAARYGGDDALAVRWARAVRACGKGAE